jgi:DNA-binding NtrC family response regulator
VRELKAAIERAVLLARGAELAASHVVLASERPAAVPVIELTADELADRGRIVAALEACAGNQTRAAKQLGVCRATLTAKLARYRIPRPRR